MRYLAFTFALLVALATSAPAQQLSRSDFSRSVRPRTDSAWLVAGLAAYGAGSAYDISQTRAGVREGTVREANPLLRDGGRFRTGRAVVISAGVAATAGLLGWKFPRLRKPLGIALSVLGGVRFGLGARARQIR